MAKFNVGDRVEVVSREPGFPVDRHTGEFCTIHFVFDDEDVHVVWERDGTRSPRLYGRQFQVVTPKPYYENTTEYYAVITGDTDAQNP